MIKARYVKVTPGSYKAAKVHLAYLEREGVERDGSAGKLYGSGRRVRPAAVPYTDGGRAETIPVHRLTGGWRETRPEGVRP